jgi:DNA-binding LacI/PurR family transcriptional regulator
VVHSDGRSGVAAVTQHLLALGHRRLAYVHCPALPDASARLRGFRTAATAGDGDVRVLQLDGLGYDEEAGSEAARRLLAESPRPTALVAGNDQQAVGALWVLLRAGVQVPGDMSVAGYDDTRYARLSAVDLTTARQDTVALGRQAVSAAVRRIEHPGLPPEVFTVAPRLVVRGSTAAPDGPAR